MKKSILALLEEIQETQSLNEDKDDLQSKENTGTDEGEEGDEGEEEFTSDHLPDGKGHYTASDLQEIIVYIRDLLKEELEQSDDDVETDKKGEPDDIGEIGLDLIYEYADLLPETVINQIVDDLKDMFEIEDTMLESIIQEGSAFFNKSKKSPAALAARKKMREFYRKNKTRILARNKKWRNTPIGKKIAALHSKIFKGIGKVKGKRVVHQL
jgi:hypothetical protein